MMYCVLYLHLWYREVGAEIGTGRSAGIALHSGITNVARLARAKGTVVGGIAVSGDAAGLRSAGVHALALDAPRAVVAVVVGPTSRLYTLIASWNEVPLRVAYATSSTVYDSSCVCVTRHAFAQSIYSLSVDAFCDWC